MASNEKNELSLSAIRQTEVELLRHFRDFCKQENICFFLSNGTLLGAVKYRGFIPWDDDIDVFVPRADYDRLMELYQDSERYCLFSTERNHSYRFPFAKLCDMTTEKVEDNIDNGVCLGVDIDIFPLDAWPNDLQIAKAQAKKQRRDIRRLDFHKCRRAISLNPIKRAVKNVVLALTRFVCTPLIRRMEKRAAAHADEPSPSWLGCVVWCIYGQGEIIPADVFQSTVDVTFEGDAYPAPSGYDLYLRSLYGDYTLDPPLDQQQTHHRYRAFYKVEGLQ